MARSEDGSCVVGDIPISKADHEASFPRVRAKGKIATGSASPANDTAMIMGSAIPAELAAAYHELTQSKRWKAVEQPSRSSRRHARSSGAGLSKTIARIGSASEGRSALFAHCSAVITKRPSFVPQPYSKHDCMGCCQRHVLFAKLVASLRIFMRSDNSVHFLMEMKHGVAPLRKPDIDEPPARSVADRPGPDQRLVVRRDDALVAFTDPATVGHFALYAAALLIVVGLHAALITTPMNVMLPGRDQATRAGLAVALARADTTGRLAAAGAAALVAGLLDGWTTAPLAAALAAATLWRETERARAIGTERMDRCLAIDAVAIGSRLSLP